MSADKLTCLYAEMQEKGITIEDYPQQRTKGTTLHNADGYGVFINTQAMETTAEEITVLAHEYGHCETGTTHAVCSSVDLVEKHENKADKWAARRLIPLEEYEEAIAKGYTEVWQLAEYFDVTEDFIRRTDYLYRCEGWQGNDIADNDKPDLPATDKNSETVQSVVTPSRKNEPIKEPPAPYPHKAPQKVEIATLGQLMRFMVSCDNKRQNARSQAKKRVSIDICGER